MITRADEHARFSTPERADEHARFSTPERADDVTRNMNTTAAVR